MHAPRLVGHFSSFWVLTAHLSSVAGTDSGTGLPEMWLPPWLPPFGALRLPRLTSLVSSRCDLAIPNRGLVADWASSEPHSIPTNQRLMEIEHRFHARKRDTCGPPRR